MEPADLDRADLLITPTTGLKQHVSSWPIDPDSLYVSLAAIAAPDAIEGVHPKTPVISADDDFVDVVIAADLPDDRPESFGISLSSQLHLWQVMRDIAYAEAKLGHGAASPQDMLATALQRSGIGLKEQAIRQQFAAWLEHQILPARRAIAAVEALQQAGIKFALYGWGWSELSDGRFQSVQDSCLLAARQRAITNTRAVVVPLAHDIELQFLLESLSQAKPVICRGSASLFSQAYPGMENVSGFVDFYGGADELVSAVQSVICPNPQATRRYEDARSLVFREHTWKHRLQAVVQHLVKRKQAPIGAAS